MLSPFTRREWLRSVPGGVAAAALASLLADDSAAADLAPRKSHFPAKANAVIHLFMNGGPSQMDLFDPKPLLSKLHGQPCPRSLAGEIEFIQSAGSVMRSPFKFAQHGKCGAWVSDAMPHFAGVVDDVAFVRSMHTTNITHEPAVYMIQSGNTAPGRPAIGSWVVYGLGSENRNLPAYVVLDDPKGLPVNGVENWQAGFLPPVFQGTRFRSTGSPVLNLKPETERPEGIAKGERALIAKLDALHKDARPGQGTLDARIASYELAARMQLAATDALDLNQEPLRVREQYGIGSEPTDSYGRRCLIARRLIERGVRFVQLFINSHIWDTHNNIATELKAACDRTDQPIAALLRDLKQRGLLDRTLVIWGGEFGRLPIAQLPADKDERKAGRDHNKNAFCSWLAGGGVKPGISCGTTDEIGLKAVENPVSVHDWHATILYLLGLSHDELTFDINGLKEKLTGVDSANVVKGILA
jgi:hypothetical protein